MGIEARHDSPYVAETIGYPCRSCAERQGAQSSSGIGRALLEDTGSDATQHTRALHAVLEKNASCEKLATDCRSKERRRPISSNQCKPRVNLSLGRESPLEQHEEYFIRSGR
jgi:hypothetical protein